MRMSTLAERRAALVDKLVEAALDEVPVFLDYLPTLEDRLRARFTAILASRWQT